MFIFFFKFITITKENYSYFSPINIDISFEQMLDILKPYSIFKILLMT